MTRKQPAVARTVVNVQSITTIASLAGTRTGLAYLYLHLHASNTARPPAHIHTEQSGLN